MFLLILLIGWFLRAATTGAGDEEFCDFALVMALLFEYISESLLAGLKLKKPSFHDVSVLL
jgi:hypothetical protein